ncbi:hypothetical protein [Streptomyces sp. NPDC051162]|uniref:hypothetical protein n=1 Tax=Streptomyces sp. NPDC051162 TaxID=3154747 RepID=UPI003447FEE1
MSICTHVPEPVVLQWGDRFASALGQLSGSGEAEVSLVIVQKVRDIESGDEKGIFFGVGLITWLPRAGTALDIDQNGWARWAPNPGEAWP